MLKSLILSVVFLGLASLSQAQTPDASTIEQAMSQGDWTYPSLASLATGSYPSRSKCFAARQQHLRRKLPTEAPVLAESLRSEGYRTFGYVSYECANQGSN